MDMKNKATRLHNPHVGSVYLWCLHCERTYLRGAFRKIRGLQMCPYNDCDGDTVFDAVPWGSIRSANPEYSVIPIPGSRYSDPRGPDARVDSTEDCPEAVLYIQEKFKGKKRGEIVLGEI